MKKFDQVYNKLISECRENNVISEAIPPVLVRLFFEVILTYILNNKNLQFNQNDLNASKNTKITDNKIPTNNLVNKFINDLINSQLGNDISKNLISNMSNTDDILNGSEQQKTKQIQQAIDKSGYKDAIEKAAKEFIEKNA